MKKTIVFLVLVIILAAISCKGAGGGGGGGGGGGTQVDELTLSVDKSRASLTGRLDTVKLMASNGVPPYRWSISGQGKGLLLSAETGKSVLVSVSQDAVILPQDSYTITLEDSASPANTKSHTFKIADIQSELYELQVAVAKDSTAGEMMYHSDARIVTTANFQADDSLTISIEPNTKWAEGLALFHLDHLEWGETTSSQMAAGGMRYQVTPGKDSLQLTLDSSLSAGDVDGIYTLTYDDGAILTGTLALELTFTITEGVVLVDQNGLSSLVGKDAVSELSVVGGTAPYTWVVKDSTEQVSDDIVLEEASAGDTKSQAVSLKTDGNFTTGSEYTVHVTSADSKENYFVYTLEDISTYGFVFDMTYAGTSFDLVYDTAAHRGVVSTGVHGEEITMSLAPNQDWTNRGFISFDQDNITWEETVALVQPSGGGDFEVIDPSQAKVTLNTSYPVGRVDGEYSFTYQDGTLDLTGSFFLSETVHPLVFRGGLANLSGSSATDTLTLDGGVGPFTWSVVGGSGDSSTALTLTGDTNRERGVSVSPGTIVSGTYKVKVVDTHDNTEIEHTYSLYANLALVSMGSVVNLVKDVTEQDSLTLSGGMPPYVWTILDDSNNPSTGLVLSGDDGDHTRIVSLPGTITEGDYTIKVVDNAAAEITHTYLVADSLALTGASVLAEGNSITMTITGGLAPYTWRLLKDSAVTTELSLRGQEGDKARSLVGDANAANGITYGIEVTDGNDTVKTHNVTYYLTPSISRNTGASLKGKGATSTASASGGSGSYRWSITSGKGGLKLSNTGGSSTAVSLKSASTHRAGDTYTVTVTDTISSARSSLSYVLEDINYSIYVSRYYIESQGASGTGSGTNSDTGKRAFTLDVSALSGTQDGYMLVLSPSGEWAAGNGFYEFSEVTYSTSLTREAQATHTAWSTKTGEVVDIGNDSIWKINLETLGSRPAHTIGGLYHLVFLAPGNVVLGGLNLDITL